MKLALVSQEIIGKHMAGPGIRYWELAKSLSRKHDVSLFSPNAPDASAEGFNLYQLRSNSQLNGFDILLVQALLPNILSAARRYGLRVVVDLYDPVILEDLEIQKHAKLPTRRRLNARLTAGLSLVAHTADAVICASQRQKDLWTGVLMQAGRLTPERYDQDPSLENLIGIIPFGLPSQPPTKTGPGFRKQFDLSQDDFLAVWSGGMWNWFDPLSAIKAIHMLSQERNDIKLVFMVTRHPNPAVGVMEISKQAVRLAEDLGIKDRYVFFNEQSIPYADLPNYFMEANAGLSIHANHLETRFSFRTRMLDYMRSVLPIVASQGDSFAEIIEQNGLGITVPVGQPEAIAEALRRLADYPQLNQEIKTNITKILPEFSWDKIADDLETVFQAAISHPGQKAYRRYIFAYYSRMLWVTAKEEGLGFLLRKILGRRIGK